MTKGTGYALGVIGIPMALDLGGEITLQTGYCFCYKRFTTNGFDG